MLQGSRPCFRLGPVALIAAALAPSVAVAQPQPQQPQPAATTPGAPVDEARQQFEAGVRAMQAHDWPAALQAFEASDRLRRSAAVALNLGVVLRELHRLVEARVRLQQFNELATPAQHEQHDAEVAQMLTDIARRLARVRVVELSPPAAVVTIDGRRAQLNEANETVVDPGTHAVRAEAPGFVAHEESVEVAESATRELRFTLAPQPAAPVATPHPAVAQPVDPRVAQTPTRPPESHPIYTRWWFWTAVGVVAAAGVTTAVVVARSASPDLPSPTTGVTLQSALSGEVGR